MVADVVIDASVTAAWCFADEASDASRELHASLTERGAVVPLLWHAESANVLLTAVRRKRITDSQCAELLDLLETLPIETDGETAHIRNRVFRLARAHGLTVYDAIYLDLAMRHAVPLATRDKALMQAAKAEGVGLVPT